METCEVNLRILLREINWNPVEIHDVSAFWQRHFTGEHPREDPFHRWASRGRWSWLAIGSYTSRGQAIHVLFILNFGLFPSIIFALCLVLRLSHSGWLNGWTRLISWHCSKDHCRNGITLGHRVQWARLGAQWEAQGSVWRPAGSPGCNSTVCLELQLQQHVL